MAYLPPEILQLIADRSDHDTLLSLRKVNKILAQAAAPALFRNIFVSWRSNRLDHVQGLASSPYRVHVRALVFDVDVLRAYPTDFPPSVDVAAVTKLHEEQSENVTYAPLQLADRHSDPISLLHLSGGIESKIERLSSYLHQFPNLTAMETLSSHSIIDDFEYNKPVHEPHRWRNDMVSLASRLGSSQPFTFMAQQYPSYAATLMRKFWILLDQPPKQLQDLALSWLPWAFFLPGQFRDLHASLSTDTIAANGLLNLNTLRLSVLGSHYTTDGRERLGHHTQDLLLEVAHFINSCCPQLQTLSFSHRRTSSQFRLQRDYFRDRQAAPRLRDTLDPFLDRLSLPALKNLELNPLTATEPHFVKFMQRSAPTLRSLRSESSLLEGQRWRDHPGLPPGTSTSWLNMLAGLARVMRLEEVDFGWLWDEQIDWTIKSQCGALFDVLGDIEDGWGEVPDAQMKTDLMFEKWKAFTVEVGNAFQRGDVDAMPDLNYLETPEISRDIF